MQFSSGMLAPKPHHSLSSVINVQVLDDLLMHVKAEVILANFGVQCV